MSKNKSTRRLFIWILTVMTTVLSCFIFYNIYDNHLYYPPLSVRPVPGKALFEGMFELNVSKPLNPTSLVRYAVPLDKESGLPLPSASTVVFYAPFNGEAGQIRSGLPAWVRDLSIKHGFSVFSLSIEANIFITDDHSQYYIYPESGWPTLVFRIHEHLVKEFGLEPRRLIVIGESSGGSMAQHMACAFPEKISVAAWNGGLRYTAFPSTCDARMLALNVWGCPGLEPTASMVREGLDKGIDIRHLVTPPAWHESGQFEQHGAWELSYRLITEFILNTPEFNQLAKSLPPADFAEQTTITFPVPDNASAHVILVDRPYNSDELFLNNIMWDAVHRQMAATAVVRGGTPEETSTRVRSFLSSNPFPDLPVVIFTTDEVIEPPTGIQVKVMNDANEWTKALHSLTGDTN